MRSTARVETYLAAAADGEEDVAGGIHEEGLLPPLVGVVVHPEDHPPIGTVVDGVAVPVEEQRLAPDRELDGGR